jgi:transcriptional regulator GlxA family with amidase domain
MKNHLILFALFIAFSSCAQPKRMNVAVLVHDGVQLLDFTGPSEVFSDVHIEGHHAYNVYTVAPTEDEITSQGFLKVKPNYSISNCPPPDIIILPGGDTDIPLKNKKVIEWIRTAGEKSQHLLSVCTGALLLAECGFLDNKQATTHYCCQDGLAKDYPKVKVVKGVRYIDNGKVITTEGISAGIDGALYLVGKINGKEVARKVATYMMYDWNEDRLKTVVVENN